MTKTKDHREFYQVDMEAGWVQIPGYPEGMAYKVLADDFDEVARTGSRTRLIRWPPGAMLPNPVVHDFAEEVFVLSGDLVVIDSTDGSERPFGPNTYACRPANVPHGPFRTETGCLMLETHMF